MVAVIAGGWLAEGGLDQAWAQPSRLPVTMTVEAGFVSRDVIVQELVGGLLVEDSTIADSSRLLVTVAVTPVRPLTLYLVGGGANLNLEEFGYNANLNGIYGGGVTVILYDSAPHSQTMSGFSLFLDGRYLRFVTDDLVTVDIGGGTLVSTTEEITWDESRLRFGVKGGYYGFQPYGGIELSWIRGNDRLEGFGSFDIREEDNIGLFGGLLFPLDPEGRLGFFVEVNVIDEYALRGGVVFAL